MIYPQPARLLQCSPASAPLFSPPCAKERFSNSPVFTPLRTLQSLLHCKSEAHPLSLQSHPHSFVKTPGVAPQGITDMSSFTLGGHFKSLPPSPVEPAHTQTPSPNPFRIRTYEKSGDAMSGSTGAQTFACPSRAHTHRPSAANHAILAAAGSEV